jgi:hypothetical protein
VISELTVPQGSALLHSLAHGCYRGLRSEGKASAIGSPPPPLVVIAKVTSAKKVFVSNAGAEDLFVYDIPGGANVSYNEFYASLKQWAYFQLVDSPTQADLIFEIRGTETCHDVLEGKITDNHYIPVCGGPMLNLSILDPSTRGLLYKIVVPAGRGSNKAKGAIAFTQSIDALTAQVKALVAAPAPMQNP